MADVQLLAIKLACHLLVEATYAYVLNPLVVLPRRSHHLTLPSVSNQRLDLDG
jgi:hypothetical protein